MYICTLLYMPPLHTSIYTYGVHIQTHHPLRLRAKEELRFRLQKLIEDETMHITYPDIFSRVERAIFSILSFLFLQALRAGKQKQTVYHPPEPVVPTIRQFH